MLNGQLKFKGRYVYTTVPYVDANGAPKQYPCVFIPTLDAAGKVAGVSFDPTEIKGTLIRIPPATLKTVKHEDYIPIKNKDDYVKFTFRPNRPGLSKAEINDCSEYRKLPKHERYAHQSWLKGFLLATQTTFISCLNTMNGLATSQPSLSNGFDPNLRQLDKDAHFKKGHLKYNKDTASVSYVSASLVAPENYTTMEAFLHAVDTVITKNARPEITILEIKQFLASNPAIDKAKLDVILNDFVSKLPDIARPAPKFSPRALAHKGITDKFFIYKATTDDWQKGTNEAFYKAAIKNIQHKPGFTITASELHQFRKLVLGPDIDKTNPVDILLTPGECAVLPSHIVRDIFAARSIGKLKTRAEIAAFVKIGLEVNKAYVDAATAKQGKTPPSTPPPAGPAMP
jgi:hypothetical protein